MILLIIYGKSLSYIFLFFFSERGGLIHHSDLTRQKNAKNELKALIMAHGVYGLFEEKGHDYVSGLRFICELLSKRDMFLKVGDAEWRVQAQVAHNTAIVEGKARAKDDCERLINDMLDNLA